METRVGSIQTNKNIAHIDQNTVVKVDPIGFYGGIQVLQTEDKVDGKVISHSNQMVNLLRRILKK